MSLREPTTEVKRIIPHVKDTGVAAELALGEPPKDGSRN